MDRVQNSKLRSVYTALQVVQSIGIITVWQRTENIAQKIESVWRKGQNMEGIALRTEYGEHYTRGRLGEHYTGADYWRGLHWGQIMLSITLKKDYGEHYTEDRL